MKPKTVIVRAVAALASLVVVAWLALGLRAAVLTERATDQLLSRSVQSATPKRTAALQRAANDLDRARLLNPDRLPDAYRARALAVLGDAQRARALAVQLKREEPENLEILGSALVIGRVLDDRRLETDAGRRINELNPRGAIR